MAIDLAFRRRAVRTLTNAIGCYALCDLDGVPIYVGQSRDGIRARVNRHLTSARSDIIANRQVDVWEIAWVWAYPVENLSEIDPLENALFRAFHAVSPLMNGRVPPIGDSVVPDPTQIVQVMNDDEISEVYRFFNETTSHCQNFVIFLSKLKASQTFVLHRN